MHSEQDLKYAADFRDGIHREALAEVRKHFPDANEIVDRYDVEDYFQKHWDYPGVWYDTVAIPSESKSRQNLIKMLVEDTLEQIRNGGLPSENRKPAASKNYGCNLSGEAKEIADKSRFPDDGFYALIKEYPDCVPEFCIVKDDGSEKGFNAHRHALTLACERLFADGEGGFLWSYDIKCAKAEPVKTGRLFSSETENGTLSYRKAFLHPPHPNGYTELDFIRINEALFPNGADCLEVYEWTTDWSDYFDDGHEWWGALCYTVYDKALERFVIIIASATD